MELKTGKNEKLRESDRAIFIHPPSIMPGQKKKKKKKKTLAAGNTCVTAV